jgi:hypothetical protein
MSKNTLSTILTRLATVFLLGAFFIIALGCPLGMPMSQATMPGMSMCNASFHSVNYILPVKEGLAINLITLSLGILVINLFWGRADFLHGITTIPFYAYLFGLQKTLAQLYNYLLAAFQRGILHPQIY